MRLTVVTLFASDPAEVSLLHLLWHLHAAGGFERQTNVAGGVQQDRVVGGMQAIADRIAEHLGAALQLGAPVREVRDDGDGVEVDADGVTVRARRTVVAVPPTLSGHIRYAPPLLTERALLLQRLPAGSTLKIALVYDRAFWRSNGLSGLSLGLGSTVQLTIDGCGETVPPAILTAFVAGPDARRLAQLPAAERRALIVGDIAAWFGPEAARPRHYHEQDWAAEEWTRGCYMAHYPPGVLTQLGPALREPHGRIHWAGTETSPVMNGFIDGAVRSGERVADEVLAALGAEPALALAR
jgi:monoamine oxidase